MNNNQSEVSAVGAEIDRQVNYPAAREGDVEMTAYRFDDVFNCYVAEWSDGVTIFQ